MVLQLLLVVPARQFQSGEPENESFGRSCKIDYLSELMSHELLCRLGRLYLGSLVRLPSDMQGVVGGIGEACATQGPCRLGSCLPSAALGG